MKNEQRIWNLKELEANPEFRVDSDGDWCSENAEYWMDSSIIGKTVDWCESNGWMVCDWMIATTTDQQEPQEGDLVYVWDEDERPEKPEKAIILWKHENCDWCICVEDGYEEAYKNGHRFDFIRWKNYEPIPQKTPQQEIAEKVGKTIKELKEIFKG